MAITKNIEIDGRAVAFRASAASPRLYRARFGRDLLADLDTLIEGMNQGSAENSSLSALDLELFENIAYTMAKQADPGIPETPEEWLDTFEIFSIYNVLPQIMEMWQLNTLTTSESKKKARAATAR